MSDDTEHNEAQDDAARAQHAEEAEEVESAEDSEDIEELGDPRHGEGTQGPGLGRALFVERDDLPGALEALILVSDKPVSAVRLARLSRSDLDDVKAALEQVRAHYAGRGIVLDEVAGGFQFRTHPRYAPVVRTLIQQKPVRLTRAQLEVLSIIAYRQPVTRPEVEEVRGVDSGSALRVLLERAVIRIIGKRDEAGRPMLYATTPDFLSLFGLRSLRDLPTLKEFTELSDESRDMFERRIGERPPLEGFTEGAQDARTVAEREAALRADASEEDAQEEAARAAAAEFGTLEGEECVEAEAVDEPQADSDADAEDAELVADGEWEPNAESEREDRT